MFNNSKGTLKENSARSWLEGSQTPKILETPWWPCLGDLRSKKLLYSHNVHRTSSCPMASQTFYLPSPRRWDNMSPAAPKSFLAFWRLLFLYDRFEAVQFDPTQWAHFEQGSRRLRHLHPHGPWIVSVHRPSISEAGSKPGSGKNRDSAKRIPKILVHIYILAFDLVPMSIQQASDKSGVIGHCRRSRAHIHCILSYCRVVVHNYLPSLTINRWFSIGISFCGWICVLITLWVGLPNFCLRRDE
jgi:hypothetical protein